MNLRSLLFIPGDSEKKLAKGAGSGADALILDLEDAVAPSRKAIARDMVGDYLRSRVGQPGPQLWVRINPLDEGGLDDLATVARAAPAGIMVPKTDGPLDLVRLSHYLDALERRDNVDTRIGIIPVATETAKAPFRLAHYADHNLPRLVGVTWGAEDLSSAIGASTNKGPDGDWAFTYRMVRSACLLAAKASEVQAIETLYADFRDEAGLRASCASAAQEGFTGRIAIHPAQVPVINETFRPSEADVTHARRILAAFDAMPEAGTVGLDGKMLDIPHLKQARKIVELHEAYARG
jgi:citrate lyase subunit beta/citryl-CoA lyase